jgi:hypothetical protein
MIDVQQIITKAMDRIHSGTAICEPTVELSKWSGFFDELSSDGDNEIAWTDLEEAYLLNCLHYEHSPSLTCEHEDRIVELIAWAAITLADWNEEADPKGQHLRVIFAIAISLRISAAQIWQLADSPRSNPKLVAKLGQYISRVKVHVVALPGQNSAEVQFLANFTKADEQGDWATLAQDAPQILDLVHCPWLGNIAEFLNGVARDQLLEALANVVSVLTAHSILSGLKQEDAAALAAVTNNNYFRFSLLLSLGKGSLISSDDIPATMQTDLAKIWQSVSGDLSTWSRWLAAFNKYPIRFPLLQNSLGLALATMRPEAMAAYVNAVSMSSGLNCRNVMADCFINFRSAASSEQQRQLWKLAFDRWTSWNFGGDSDGVLLGIKMCPLDFAVIAHISEGMTSEERSAELTRLANEALEIEIQWHRDISQCRMAHNRLLSRFHFIATGDDKLTGNNDLLDNKIRTPQAVQSNAFHIERISMNDVRLV